MTEKQIIKIFPSVDNLSDFFAEFLKQQVDEIPDNIFFSIALSGGSTPEKIYRHISENYRDKINWDKIKIFFGDERCVPPDSEESNFKMANENLLKNIKIPEKNIFRIKGENNPKEEAARYEEELKNNIPVKNGIPKFDLIMLGLGKDGHTASIFSNHIDLFFASRLCSVAVHPKTKRERITITGKVINNAKLVTFIVTGEKKAVILNRLFSNDNSERKFPAAFVLPKDGKIIWILDQDAARLLNSGTAFTGKHK